MYGGAIWTDGLGGQFGTALKFDGSNQAYVEWVISVLKCYQLCRLGYKENLGNWQRMFDFANGPGDHNLLLANRWTSNEAEWSIRRGGTNRSLVVQDFWELNQWQHVVATVDDSGLMKLYSNGELKGSYLGHLPQGVTRTRQYVGRSNWGNDWYFMGMIDDLRVYDRAISRDEVETIYSGDLEKTVILGGESFGDSFWGDEDAGETTDINASSSGWDNSVSLGVNSVGSLEYALSGLPSGRFLLPFDG